ncbi:MAG: thioredoxin domain-containing protein [Firmicutes bacterium]|nr:thioredoxin domain-containing protein [Bacillota bacterium]
MDTIAGKKQNRLAKEKSPYLRQHATNPVDWYPWGDEAFAAAKAADKPVLLSIGYSTCHWCHVMERESFADPEVAAVLNEAFIPVKVDREERPDLDGIYMTVCQAMTGSGGWPLTIIMTPDQKPFFAGTYFPKTSSFGRIGLLELAKKIQELWRTRREELLAVAAHNLDLLREAEGHDPGGPLAPEVLDRGFIQLAELYDERNGGFGFAPKFPTPHHLLFLLRYWQRTGKPEALAMVEQTLTAMRYGGIYDQLGFGFHRYSTDERWFLPHFEKMLFDQAMLLMAYLEAYQVTGRALFRQTAEEVYTYLMTVLRDESGGFYSAEDADSEGVEGKFYLWSWPEVHQELSPEEARLATAYFNLEPGGNVRGPEWPDGANLFYITDELPTVARRLGISPVQAEELLTFARAKLLARRAQRVPPFKDEKILTDWNGLLLVALAKGGQVLQNKAWIQTAEATARFLLTVMRAPGGGLWHRYYRGEAGIHGFLEDYAYLIWGLLELYGATFEADYLAEALALTTVLQRSFLDAARGGYFQTGAGAEHVLVRQKEFYDGAVPSGNSVMLLNLLKLARITGDPSLQEAAERSSGFFGGLVAWTPVNYTFLLSALDFAFGPGREIVIVGQRGEEMTERMLSLVQTTYQPRSIGLFCPATEADPVLASLAPFTKELTAPDGKTTAYVCRNYQCSLPTTAWDQFRQLVQE